MDRGRESGTLRLALGRSGVSDARIESLVSRYRDTEGSLRELLLEHFGSNEVDALLKSCASIRLEQRLAEESGDTTLTCLPSLPSLEGVPVTNFPVENWDRYRFISYLGGGGMGRVFKAFDPRLERAVALKFIRGDDPGLIERLKHEAHAQAHVDHDRICKIYDVGYAGDRPYIAMQLIDGLPLGEAARTMTLEQKLVAIAEIAEALHEAHRAGLIHRDIKPSNILVERTKAGRWKPYLVDFGLAREQEDPGMTATGAVIGTPSFMSPEQARGRVRELDRRADVYGLGATLYAILAGRPPFVEHDPTERMRQLLQDPPDSLRRSDASIPVDVEAIAMKCLRKQPHERYPSARALADDLHRYLDGQPIEARPTTFIYRSRLWAERNKPVVVIAAAAVILIAVFAVREAYNGWDAARRVRLAQSFGQRVEQIEALARYSHMAPLHDIRAEREMICERVDDIARRMDLAGPIAFGPGHYAMGRGYLAMGSHERARQELEIAWESGFREPSVAYALGQVMGELYKAKLQEVERIPDELLREARRHEVEEAYREPAVRYLRQSRGSELESPGLIEARLAYLEERYEEALLVARETASSFPWIYEARQLEGEVFQAMATAKGHRGLHDAAMEDYTQAETAYRSAAAVAESDPLVYTALCELARSVMRTQFLGRGDEVAPQFEKGVQACNHALVVDPVCVDALVAQSRLHEAMGESQRQRGQDPTEHLDLAVAKARAALEIRPDTSAAFSTICIAENERADFLRERGRDPVDSMQAAFMACQRAVELSPDAESFNELGLIFKARALDERDRGDDPRASLRKAIEAFRSSLARNSSQVAANNNVGLAFFHLGKYEMNRGQDPRGSFAGAVRAYQQAIAINPDQIVVLYNLGRIWDGQAAFELENGAEPRASFNKAAKAYRRAIEINPDSAYAAHFYTGMGVALDGLASYDQQVGEDPRESFEKALGAYEQAIAKNANYALAHVNRCHVYNKLAEFELDRGNDPRAPLDEAVASCRQAIAIKSDDLFAHASLGDAFRIRGLFELEQGLDPQSSLDRGKSAFGNALGTNPNDAYTHTRFGRLLIVEARSHAKQRFSPEAAFERAHDALGKALEWDPDDPETCLSLAELYRQWAKWRYDRGLAAGDFVDRGLDMAARPLSRNPNHARALALRGALLLLGASGADRPADRSRLLLDARASIGMALSANRNLAHRFEPLLRSIDVGVEAEATDRSPRLRTGGKES